MRKEGKKLKAALDLVYGRHSGQTQLAAALGVSDRMVRFWVSGARTVPQEVWAALYFAGGRKIEDLNKLLEGIVG